MLFDVDGFYVDLVEYKDLDEIVDVYNSNKNFLMVHLDAYKVEHEWLINDIKDMKEAGFYSCKIIEGPSTARNAIKLLKTMNFKSDVVDDANSIYDDFVKNQKWSTV